MLVWLAEQFKNPETLATLGALGVTAGFVVRNFLKGLREGQETPPQPVIPLEANAISSGAVLAVLRQMLETLEGTHVHLRRQAEDELDTRAHLRRIREGIEETNDGIRNLSREMEKDFYVLVQIRDWIRLRDGDSSLKG
jgi:hypothetical protein